jgi:hypothetical protein
VARGKGCYKVILDCADHNVAFYEKCGLTRKEIQMVSRHSSNPPAACHAHNCLDRAGAHVHFSTVFSAGCRLEQGRPHVQQVSAAFGRRLWRLGWDVSVDRQA